MSKTPSEELRTHYLPFNLLLLWAFCHGSAWAHANAGIDSIDVVPTTNGDRPGIETTVGYIKPLSTSSFEWLCHETVTQTGALITPQYTENSAGIVLATVGDPGQAKDPNETVYRSADGCEWSPPSGLSGQRVIALEFDPNNDSRALAATANPNGENRIFRSIDSGETWSSTDLSVDGKTFRSLRFASGLDGVVWASSVRHETEEAWVYRSLDGGMSWSEHAVEVRPAGGLNVYVDVLVADSRNPETAWVVMGPFLDDQLLRTADGGLSFESVYEPDGDIIDGTQDREGGIWLITTGNKTIHSADGDSFRRVDTAPLSLGVGADAVTGQVHLATRVMSENHALSTSIDGSTFESVDIFGSLLGPPECPADTDSYIQCNPLWPELAATLYGSLDTGSPSDTGTSPTEIPRDKDGHQGCQCSHAPSPNPALLMFVIGWMGWQRTRKRTPLGRPYAPALPMQQIHNKKRPTGSP